MFKKVCSFLFFILFFSNFAFASYEDSLFELETLKYGKSFQNESISQRLLRLEEDYFGLSQSGDISSRISMLNKIAQNNYPNTMNLERRINTKKQNRIISAIFNLFPSYLEITTTIKSSTFKITIIRHLFSPHYPIQKQAVLSPPDIFSNLLLSPTIK